jgi:hypothetical protein
MYTLKGHVCQGFFRFNIEETMYYCNYGLNLRHLSNSL